MSIQTLHDPTHRGFASDNHAGVHPDVLSAIAAADGGHQAAYGADAYTARLQDVVRDHFGPRAEAFGVFNGTGANVLALAAMTPRWGAVVTAAAAHLHNDEGGAPEQVAGLKLLTVPTPDGRLTPELLDVEAWGHGNEHRAQPLAVSITQSTELGTVYTADQVGAVAERAHARGLGVHLDGSRLWNAAAALEVPLRALTADVGVDVVSLGGTKIGALAAELVVVLDPSRVDGLPYLRKRTMQLASKMRFVSTQMLALFEDDLGLRNGTHANAMATRLREGVEALGSDAVTFSQPTEANAVLARPPREVADRVRERFAFYDWDAARGEVRWMTAWDITPEDVDAFVALLGRALTSV